MQTLRPLLIASAIALLSVFLPAQERLPDSYLEKLTTIDHLQNLTSTDLAILTSRAESGAPDAQYQLEKTLRIMGSRGRTAGQFGTSGPLGRMRVKRPRFPDYCSTTCGGVRLGIFAGWEWPKVSS